MRTHPLPIKHALSAALFVSIGCAGSPSPVRSSTNAPVAQSAPAATAPTPPATVAPAPPTAIGEAPAEFPASAETSWVNGSPAMLASARGDVVLVESWHRL